MIVGVAEPIVLMLAAVLCCALCFAVIYAVMCCVLCSVRCALCSVRCAEQSSINHSIILHTRIKRGMFAVSSNTRTHARAPPFSLTPSLLSRTHAAMYSCTSLQRSSLSLTNLGVQSRCFGPLECACCWQYLTPASTFIALHASPANCKCPARLYNSSLPSLGHPKSNPNP